MEATEAQWLKPLPPACIDKLSDLGADASVVAAVSAAYSRYQMLSHTRKSEPKASEASRHVDRIDTTIRKLNDLLDSLPTGIRVHADDYLRQHSGTFFVAEKTTLRDRLKLLRDACWVGDRENTDSSQHLARGGKRARPDDAALLADLALAVEPLTGGKEASYDLAAELAPPMGYIPPTDTKDRGKRVRQKK